MNPLKEDSRRPNARAYRPYFVPIRFFQAPTVPLKRDHEIIINLLRFVHQSRSHKLEIQTNVRTYKKLNLNNSHFFSLDSFHLLPLIYNDR